MGTNLFILTSKVKVMYLMKGYKIKCIFLEKDNITVHLDQYL